MSPIDYWFNLPIISSKMCINYTKDPSIMGMFNFTPEVVIQNGSIFKSQTHKSGHFDIGVPLQIPHQKSGCGLNKVAA